MAGFFLFVLLLVVAIFSVKFLQGVFNRCRKWRTTSNVECVLREQGIRGPVPQFFAGNLLGQHKLRISRKEKGTEGISHDIVPHVTPEVHLWSMQYGKPYLYWWLGEPRITLFDPEMCRSIMSTQSDNFPKSADQLEMTVKFIGRGVGTVNGEEWSHHRRILLPAFHVRKLKGMLATFQDCAQRLVDDWSKRVSHGQAEVEITKDVTKFAADAISRTAFSSNYNKGQRVFELLHVLIAKVLKLYAQWSWLPWFSHLPIPLNLAIWKLQKEINYILLAVIRERRSVLKTSPEAAGQSLLDLIIIEGGSDDDKAFSDEKIVGECKTFYFAGHETTACLLNWTLLLLALNPHWQERARAEAQEHCSNGFEHGEVLGKLKLIGMILNETLRLYPPANEIKRVAKQDTVLPKGLKLPKGTAVSIPILSLHHDKEIWGEDVNEFHPERFAPNGAAKTNAFMPFGFGPRVCIGQVFAQMEVKITLAMLLMNFSFKLAPMYKHNPIIEFLLIPEHGIQLLIERI